VASKGSNPPRIGLSTYRERIQMGPLDRRAAVLPETYLDSITAAGGMPLLLPPVDVAGGATAAVDALDALVLTGGADVDPSFYGADAHPKTRGTRTDRDAWEGALLEAALAADLPVLAICRGVQFLNAALGGTLHQHVPDIVGHEEHGHAGDVYNAIHVKVEPGSRLQTIIGEDSVVRCHHHQAVDQLGDGLVVTARADDGIVEAVEDPSRRFLLGVQWHPEQGDDPRLFDALIAAARR
jgi:putative glutamine amidotransferase